MAKDGDMRLLGAVDGFCHALIDVRQQIGHLTYYPIDKRHVRRIKARDGTARCLSGGIPQDHGLGAIK